MKKGDKFGRLTALWFVEKRAYIPVWLFSCDCGGLKQIRIDAVLSGRARSCGCYHRNVVVSSLGKQNKTHGLSKTKIYYVWKSMRSRCSNPNREDYERYGGRGIRVCDEWETSFELFLEDMGECPIGMSLDRINNEGHYEPGNCRWATKSEQVHNRRARRVKA